MAGFQPARRDARAETVGEFMARRNRETLTGAEADSAGRAAWIQSTASGRNLAAARPSDVRTLGMQALASGGPRPVTSVRASRPDTISYGHLQTQAPSQTELDELRHQQAEFGKVTHDIDVKNSWMAVPALAPGLVVLGLEGLGAIGGALAGPAIKRAPFQFLKRDPYLRSATTTQRERVGGRTPSYAKK